MPQVPSASLCKFLRSRGLPCLRREYRGVQCSCTHTHGGIELDVKGCGCVCIYIYTYAYSTVYTDAHVHAHVHTGVQHHLELGAPAPKRELHRYPIRPFPVSGLCQRLAERTAVASPWSSTRWVGVAAASTGSGILGFGFWVPVCSNHTTFLGYPISWSKAKNRAAESRGWYVPTCTGVPSTQAVNQL